MIKSSLRILLLLCCAPLIAGAQYTLDTLTTSTPGPGVVYMKFREPSGPNLIYVLETNLRNPYVKMQSVKAKGLKVGLERPSVMAAEQDSAGHHVVGIVNADFFTDKAPNSMQVVKGEITRKERIGYSVVAFDTSNRYSLAYPVFTGSIAGRGMPITIDNVDEPRVTDQLVVYNSYAGTTTPTATAGTEAVLAPVDGWFVNDTVRCIVRSIAASTGGTPIGRGQMVLSAEGPRAVQLSEEVNAGDTVGVYIRVSPAPQKVSELVGGRPIFFRDGRMDTSAASVKVMGVRHPRTIIGFSRDSSTCYLIVVDGRRAESVGMDIREMSALMSRLGIDHAMNLDGGGSSTMFVNGVTVNTPSDGKERPVANALMIISTAPPQENSHGE